MKVIFLDFDGVLNSHEWSRRMPAGSSTMGLDPASVGLLNQLVLRTGAKVVISSTWRLFDGMDAIGSLRRAGFIGEVIGVTPDGSEMRGAVYGAVCRGTEIKAWLDANPGVTDFVIVDDDADMGHLKPRLLKTSFDKGLQQHHVDSAAAAFGCATRLYGMEGT